MKYLSNKIKNDKYLNAVLTKSKYPDVDEIVSFLEENGFETDKTISAKVIYSGNVKIIANANVPFYILNKGENSVWSKSIMFGDNCSNNKPHKIFFIRTSKLLIDTNEPSCFMYWTSNDFNETYKECYESTAVKLKTYEEMIDVINNYIVAQR